MNSYADIAKLFEEQTSDIDFFQNSEILSIKRNLSTIFASNTKQLIFMIGEPGVGKTAFLNNFDAIFEHRYHTIKFDMPFFEPVDFVTMLIKKADHTIEQYSLEELIKQLIGIYKDSNYIILIDEAQLLSKQMLEIIRILADSKAFWFLLAMHKHESKGILEEPQFASRPHKVLELGRLQKYEYRDFLHNELMKIDRPYLAEHLSKKYLNYIYKITHGNFRDLKKLLFHLFTLMHYATEHNKQKYQRISKCLLLMAAIDGGLLDV